MGVRVAFVVGNTPGRDHGIFPTILRSELNDKLIAQGLIDTNERLRFIDRLWPVPVSLDMLMQMTWRVREWEVSGSSILYTGSKTPGETWSMTASFESFSMKAKRVSGVNLRDVTDEKDLLGPYTDTATMPEWKTLRNAGVRGFTDPDAIDVSAVDSDTGTETGPFVTPKGFYEMILFGDYTIFDPNTQMFYPKLGFDALFQNLTDFGALGTSGPQLTMTTLSTAPLGPPLPPPAFGLAADVQQGSLTIVNPIAGNVVVPLGMFGSPGGSSPPAWLSGGSGSVSLTMTPVKWWPYATKAGAPVYSEEDGSTLADPFS